MAPYDTPQTKARKVERASATRTADEMARAAALRLGARNGSGATVFVNLNGAPGIGAAALEAAAAARAAAFGFGSPHARRRPGGG